MSNLLEEAIIDAKALKEAAMKTAEKSIVEKYSDEVKNQISKILEAEMGMDNATPNNPLEKIPLAALDGETSIGDDEEIEIDLSDLADMASEEEMDIDDMEPTELSLGQIAQAADDSGGEDDLAGLDVGDDPMDQDELSEEDMISQIVLALQEELNEEEVKVKEMDAPEQHKMPEMEKVDPMQKAKDLEEERANEEDGKKSKDKKDLDIPENVRNIAKELDKAVDMHKSQAQRLRKAGVSEELKNKDKADLDKDGKLSSYEKKRGAAIEKAMDDDEEEKKESLDLANEFATLQESINTLGNENTELKTSNASIVEENKKLKDTLQSLNEVFEDLVLQNAQLVYTNKVLEVSSLNERQKEKIVGAIRESKSAEEAKVVFETLQNAVSSSGNKSPQSLNEVFSKNSTKMISRKETNNETLPVASRWKTLAGIK